MIPKGGGGQKYESYNTPGELLSKKCLIVAPLLISEKSARKSPLPHLLSSNFEDGFYKISFMPAKFV